MKKFLKNNKIVLLFVFVILVMTITLAVMILPLYSSRSGDEYGKRLAGIKNVPIGKQVSNDIKSLYKDTGRVQKVKTDLKGKIYNILVYVNDGVDLNEFIDLSNNAITKFSEDHLKYYDIQIFIISTSEENKKTIVGYKNKDSMYISWTNNR